MRTLALRLVALVPFALILMGSNCNDGPVSVVPNTAPSITITAPEPPEEGSITVPEGDSVRIVARVSDPNDPSEDLSVRWTAQRIDTVAEDTQLAEGNADSGGFAETIVAGLDPGEYRVIARVTDTDGASGEASLVLEFLGANVAPAVVITQPLDNAVVVEGEPVTFTGTVSDDRSTNEVDVEWFSNLDGLLDVAPPAQGLLTFTRSNLSIGVHTVTLTASDAEGAQGTDTVLFEVVAADSPPTDPVIAIQPANPDTSDDLFCAITQGSADPDGLQITYAYEWFKNGSLTTSTTATILSGQTEPTDEWTCKVTATDGTLFSNQVEATVVIGNTPPTMDEAVLTPAEAYEDTVFTCTGTGFADVDGDPEAYIATWYVDGIPVPGVTDPVLDGQWFDKGQTVQCELEPFDGVTSGPSETSNTVTVWNTAPTDPVVVVSPEPSVTIDASVACLVDTDSTDIDGDVIVNPGSYEVEWWVDGVLDPTSMGLWIVPAARTGLGQVWTCRVRSTDGTEFSGWAEASTIVLPEPGDLVVTEFLADPKAVADVAGEWVEIYNAATYTIDLQGFELADDGSDSHVIADSLPLPPGARAVLGRNGDFLTNGGAVVSYEYGNFVLQDGQDEIVIKYLGEEIDRFDYDLTGYSGIQGHSLAYNEVLGLPDAGLNDDPTAWCPAGSPFNGPTSDFGTPGGGNDGCACFASDGDGDGFGDDPACGFPDCDDSNSAWNPAADDICENGLDENCDGLDAFCYCPDTDDDGDGFGDGALCSPSDCDDGDPLIYPGAAETCDDVDESCSGTADDGDPAYMCPPAFQVATTQCDTGGVCNIATCQTGYYDVDTAYSTGCECQDDTIAGSSCATATDLGVFDPGDSLTVTAKLPSPGAIDWYQVSFPAGTGRPGSGIPEIELIARPDSTYVFDVRYSCAGSAPACGNGGTAVNKQHFTFQDNQSYGATAYNTNNTAWPNTVYIQVRRSSPGETCATYQLQINR